MRAKDQYSLDYRGPGGRSRWIRRAFSALFAIVTMGEPVSPGGGQILIADALTGRVLDTVDLSFGDDGFIRATMDEDLLTLTVEEFAAKWMAGAPPGHA